MSEQTQTHTIAWTETLTWPSHAQADSATPDPRITAVTTARWRTAPLTAALSAVLVLALSGCAMQVPRAGDLVGMWRDGNGAARLALHDGGRCSAHLLGTAQGVADGPCTWQVGEDGDPGHLEDGRAVVRLDFSRAPHSVVGVTVFELDGDPATGSLVQDDLATDAQTTLHR